MNSQRGQVSILIALIFQVLFIFFAMVINVGLIIHDKINLQNSVDIAAYYGAMKQAEVLNSMAHVNYQIRQSWKLLNWRLWALGDAGRNRYLSSSGSPGAPGEYAAEWVPGVPPPPPGGYKGPIVCVQNSFWYESWFEPSGRPRDIGSMQNACKTSRTNAPTLRPPRPNWAQNALPNFVKEYEEQGKEAVKRYSESCKTAGIANMVVAAHFLTSYKQAVLMRRRAMQELEKLLIVNNGNDFKDLSGASVADTVRKTFLNNLTLPNKSGELDFQFYHSLNRGGQPLPFLVPIDVRLFVKYADIYDESNAAGTICKMNVKNMDEPPQNQARMDKASKELFQVAQDMAGIDTASDLRLITAEAFLNEDLSDQGQKRSLVGFEKDPWTVAYVVVKAKTKPKMLFAPFLGSIELTAEAYAMPFGGKMGPWYGSQWQSGTPNSQGGLVDPLLPPRVGGAQMTSEMEWIPPRYSRFPGDNLGPRSELYRVNGLSQIIPSRATVDKLPRMEDYYNIRSDLKSANVDPIVSKKNGDEKFNARYAELAAISPDLFDVAYYSIQSKFNENIVSRAGPGFLKACGDSDGPYCWDFGSFRRSGTPQLKNVDYQISFNAKSEIGSQAFWILKSSDHLNTSWTQDSDSPDKFPEGVGVGRAGNNNGRSGYSVKIVSRRFLTRGDLPLGGGGTAGPIKNNPTAIGLGP
ncbi:MAG: Tad domain-containing protein [Oligoflexia bacterium]|nr:Tad domain-containing protein [Oligoflexia bacterium]